MCFVCSCFSWALDLLQRAITFGLACILCAAIIFGLLIAIIAGIAYGYNYSMAEFMTFTQSDVTVFMRRGQFGEAPDVQHTILSRRSGGGDIMLTNTSTDYEDRRAMGDSNPLALSWSKNHDTKKYSEILSKYGSARKMQNFEAQQPDHVREPSSFRTLLPPIELPTPMEMPIQIRRLPPQVRRLPTQFSALPTRTRGLPTRTSIQALLEEIRLKPSESPIISIAPNPLMPTVSWRSDSSNIVMRNYESMQDYGTTTKHPGEAESLFPTRTTKPPSKPLFNTKKNLKGYKDVRMKGDKEKLVPMRVWESTERPIISDYPEDIDEDYIVYKPV